MLSRFAEKALPWVAGVAAGSGAVQVFPAILGLLAPEVFGDVPLVKYSYWTLHDKELGTFFDHSVDSLDATLYLFIAMTVLAFCSIPAGRSRTFKT